MDPRFLELYNRELRYIRELGSEFAAQFPKVAARLGLDSFECADPYVERLLEGFAFLAARVQRKIDAEFPRFTQYLLEALYPHYLRPTPAMAVVRFQPDRSEGSLAEGFTIPRHTVLRSPLRKGEATPCTYRTAHELTLWPLEIQQEEYIGSASLLPEVHFPGQKPLRAGVRLRLQAQAGLKISELALDHLDLYLGSQDGAVSMRLYEQIQAHALGLAARPARSTKKSDWMTWSKDAIEPLGFAPEQALLPTGPRTFEGYRLLQEYFSFPQRFLFLRIGGLKRAVRRTLDSALDLVILLDQVDPRLEGLSTAQFQLHCTPAINLFPKRLDRIHLNHRAQEYHVVPERTRPLDFEVFSLNSVQGYGRAAEPEQEFLPFYSALHPSFHRKPNAYFTTRREKRLLSSRRKQRNIGPRSSYIGSELFLSLVDAEQAPLSTKLRQIGLEGLCTNRDLPLLMALGMGSTDFTWDFSGPVESVRCLSGPSRPRPAPPEGKTHWQLISHLSLNYLSLVNTDAEQGAAALRELLGLYAFLEESQVRKEVEGLVSVSARPIYRRLNVPGGSAFGRGLEIQLTFDETQFEGTGCFLLGAVLAQFFRKYVSLNSFTETLVQTLERGTLIHWPANPGRRNLL